ncbi:MAG: cob(I)yrinic acid a,c-diamide adenosyltransferase [Candidatus Eisenbacteria bacterium]|nr:cob(I)yrinic acid a,c-diamide adenosyltransferase [Candidatus Eisenbacteria bacterium]
MGISTGRGDQGETDLWKGGRVPKDHPRIELVGQIDELTASLGVVRAHLPPSMAAVGEDLGGLQDALLAMGSVVATPGAQDAGSGWGDGSVPVGLAERLLEELEAKLPPLRHFIRPAGPPGAAYLHAARAVCRRVERRLSATARQEGLPASLLVFLNRLGDLLFLYARQVHQVEGAAEEEWRPRSNG